jgi:hypothetical protein
MFLKRLSRPAGVVCGCAALSCLLSLAGCQSKPPDSTPPPPAENLSPDDALVVAPEVYRKAFENQYALVVNVDVPSRHRSALHTHKDLDGVIIALTDGPYRLIGEDGQATDRRQHAGAIGFREAGRASLAVKHQVENPGDGRVRAVRVELKSDPPPRSLETAPDDRRSKVEIDNQRVRVQRIRLGPREGLSAANYGPRVIVALTQFNDQRLGDARWADAGRERLENRGDGPAEVVVIELKGRE